jgi:5-methyltetrahydrofolate--homocysteine methyltransferase
MDTRIAGSGIEHLIGSKHPTTIIGNCLDTDIHPILSQSLIDGDFSIVRNEAIHQVEAGAQVLLLKVNEIGLDEESVLPEAVKVISETVPVPLCISTQSASALSKAIKVCPGKPLFNYVIGEEENLSKFLPLLVKAGVAIIGRIQDQSSQQIDAEHRVELARDVLRKCISAGVARENIILNPTGDSMLDHSGGALVLLNTCATLKRIEDINLVIHPSDLARNSSDPDEVELAFTILAIQSGATCLFTEPAKMGRTVTTTDELLGKVSCHD